MRVRGGSAFGQAAAHAFRLVAEDDRIESTPALFAALERVAAALLEEKPTMATIHNARTLVIEAARAEVSEESLAGAREAVRARAHRFLDHSRSAVERLGTIGARLVQDGQIIMMHSFSESVLAIFAQAKGMGKQFHVICTESRPLREGRFAAGRLSSLGVPVTFVTDAAMAEMVPAANWLVVGADSVGLDGTLANKMGTNLLSIVAERFDKPFYVAGELMKLQRQTQQGFPIVLERRPPGEIIHEDEFEHGDNVTVQNQFFDLTPPQRIRAIVTEEGLFAPAQMAQVWQALSAALDR